MPAKNKNSSYYDKGGISVVDIWRAKLSVVEYRGLCKGNVMKYLMRAGSKPHQPAIVDLKKARDYLNDLIESYEEEQVECK